MTVTSSTKSVSAVAWIVTQLKPFLLRYSAALACTVVASALALCDPLVMKWVIDDVLPQRKVSLLSVAACIFVSIYCSRLLCSRLAGLISISATQAVVLRLRIMLLRHLHSLSAAYYDEHAVGDVMFRLEQDVSQIGQIGGDALLSLARAIILAVLTLGAMWFLNARLTCVVLPLIPAFWFLRRYGNLRFSFWSELVQSESAKRSSFLQEHLLGIIQLQLLRCEIAEAHKFLKLARRAMRAVLKRKRSEILFSTAAMSAIAAGIGILLGYGGYQVIKGTLTVGSLVAFYSYLVRLFEPLSDSVNIDMKLQQARASANRVLQIVHARSAIADGSRYLALNDIAESAVEFNHVWYGYRPDTSVLKDLSFKIAPGEKVAIVGQTGSGKSTLWKLIVRLYDSNQGAIFVEDHNVKNIRLASLRSTVAVVPQECMLFAGSVRENLTLGKREITVSELEEVAGLTCVDEILRQLPRGWEEQVGPRGIRLSGGERQRLALARALLRRPRILILDESTSALDSTTESCVLRALRNYMGNRTTILISHRLSAMLWADRILVMEGGKVIEQGSHSQLCAIEGAYWRACAKYFQLENSLKPEGGHRRTTCLDMLPEFLLCSSKSASLKSTIQE